jgi:hypothetical protein
VLDQALHEVIEVICHPVREHIVAERTKEGFGA